MTNRVDVLDHGFVRLVDHMGSDLSIVRAARVTPDSAVGLISDREMMEAEERRAMKGGSA